MYTVPPNRVGKPGKGHPITQSYVDIFLGGCLDVSEAYGIEEFALECIRTTKGWSKYWINDRIMPRRPFEHQPQAERSMRFWNKLSLNTSRLASSNNRQGDPAVIPS